MKSVFITGGSSGLGEGLAKLYFQHGYRIGVCGRNKQKFLENFSSKKYASIQFYQVDASDRDALQKAVDEFATHGLDIMIANAGNGYETKSAIPDFGISKKVLDVNFYSKMFGFEAALKHMVPKKSGQLVAISSLAGYQGLPGVFAYSASKAAVRTMCESLYLDLGKIGIDVTCICTGFVKTPLTDKNKHPMPFFNGARQGLRPHEKSN